MSGARVAIVGGGPAGSLLAIFLARRNFRPLVVERGASFAASSAREGRSINLALAARGIHALERAGLLAEIEPLLIAMRGRLVHEAPGESRLLPYGQRPHEQIYSISRSELNAKLYELAAQRFGVEYRFGHECVDYDTAADRAIVASPAGRYELDAAFVFAADGAGSRVRKALEAAGVLEASEELLDHGYKELTIPPNPRGGFALEPHALHIWPRGRFMLIALPNLDRSFTATLFLPLEGPVSFATTDRDGVESLFAAHFADAAALIPDLEPSYAANPLGRLGTVRCRPWSHGARVLLLGDAAHAIVPFHGQGMNAAFEDCLELDRLLAAHGTQWPRICDAFERNRAENSAAIAAMALENYREMRDDVRGADFELRAALAFELERRHPGKFIPRYAMVMFHPEISYAEAQRRGAVQAALLDRLTADAKTLAAVDFELAATLVEASL